MVEDLIKMEAGIEVDAQEPRIVKVGLLLHAADNLEAHLLGGFSGSFSSKSVCRFCHIQYSQLDDNIHNFDGDEPHKKWTVSEYDKVAKSLARQDTDQEVEEIIENFDNDNEEEHNDYEDDEEDDDDEEEEDDVHEEDEVHNKWGIKSDCPLNILQSFHCVNGFPPGLRFS